MPQARSVIPPSPFNDILPARFQCLFNRESSLLLVHRTDSSGLLILKEDSNSEACCDIPPAQFPIWDHPEAQLSEPQGDGKGSSFPVYQE